MKLGKKLHFKAKCLGMRYITPENMLLLRCLAQLSPNSSKNTLRSWIKEGRVQVDNRVIKLPNQEINAGQTIEVGQRKKFIQEDIEILYEDSDLVVIDKPSGLLSVSAAYEKADTAHAVLKNHFHPRRVFVVHRLDQDTSGVMVFAFNEKTCTELKKLFAAHDIQREYAAVVEGKMSEGQGTWESYLIEDRNYHVYETEDTTAGEKATTHFKIKKASRKYTWLTLKLETGKKNQIRVHCQSAGFPVVGDKKYGAQTNPIKRLCLHAQLLAFLHPISKKIIKCESPIPDEFFKLK